MVAFLRWCRSILVGTLNGFVKIALALVLIVVVLGVVGLAKGDGLPPKIILSMDLRQPMADSSAPSPFGFGSHRPTVMDIVLGLDAAQRDNRVKGVFMRVGSADMPVAQAEEIRAAIQRFRSSGKFVIAYAQGFFSEGLGDYLAASSANEIWMEPKSPFEPAGTAGGAIFLRGLFDKIQAEPQIVKRAEYKSAADMFMEKGYTPANREETQEVLQSWYNVATAQAASDRRLDQKSIVSAIEQSPQFAGSVLRAHLIDRIGYDDDAQWAALRRAGADAKAIDIVDYVHTKQRIGVSGGNIALIEAAGDIQDGKVETSPFGGENTVIAGDNLSQAIRAAADDKSIKAIVLRVDSPGGSVTASDQILNAVKKAQAKGKPVVISMGSLAASGGYYISSSANKIVAEPGTLTGSIGVLTGKVSVGKTLGLIGVTAEDIGVGKNALFNSGIEPYTPEQLANLNAQADAIYADFTQKVAAGRKLPLAQVQAIAKGRVWTGADAKARGLVDRLGGFWTAVDEAKKLAGIGPNEQAVFKRYPQPKGFFQAFSNMFGQSAATMRAMQGLVTIMSSPPARIAIRALNETPRGGVEMRAVNLPGQAY